MFVVADPFDDVDDVSIGVDDLEYVRWSVFSESVAGYDVSSVAGGYVVAGAGGYWGYPHIVS